MQGSWANFLLFLRSDCSVIALSVPIQQSDSQRYKNCIQLSSTILSNHYLRKLYGVQILLLYVFIRSVTSQFRQHLTIFSPFVLTSFLAFLWLPQNPITANRCIIWSSLLNVYETSSTDILLYPTVATSDSVSTHNYCLLYGYLCSMNQSNLYLPRIVHFKHY